MKYYPQFLKTISILYWLSILEVTILKLFLKHNKITVFDGSFPFFHFTRLDEVIYTFSSYFQASVEGHILKHLCGVKYIHIPVFPTVVNA